MNKPLIFMILLLFSLRSFAQSTTSTPPMIKYIVDYQEDNWDKTKKFTSDEKKELYLKFLSITHELMERDLLCADKSGPLRDSKGALQVIIRLSLYYVEKSAVPDPNCNCIPKENLYLDCIANSEEIQKNLQSLKEEKALFYETLMEAYKIDQETTKGIYHILKGFIKKD